MFGARVGIGTDASHTFPQAVLAVIPLTGSRDGIIEVLGLIPGLRWDKEFRKRLEETENKAWVPQARCLVKVILKELRAGHWAAGRECSWEVPISGQWYRGAL